MNTKLFPRYPGAPSLGWRQPTWSRRFTSRRCTWYSIALSVVAMVCQIGGLASSVSATLIVRSSAPPASPLTVLPEDISSPLLLSVFDDGTGPPPEPEDRLTGWQLTLMIVPDAGADGTLKFQTATLPASNYLLESADNAGLTTIQSSASAANDTLTAFDFTDTDGVSVPAEPGADVLELEFLSSADAQGTFGLFVAGGPGLTEWSDQVPNVREFANIASTGLTHIADIRIVPEPASLCIALLATITVLLVVRRRQEAILFRFNRTPQP